MKQLCKTCIVVISSVLIPLTLPSCHKQEGFTGDNSELETSSIISSYIDDNSPDVIITSDETSSFVTVETVLDSEYIKSSAKNYFTDSSCDYELVNENITQGSENIISIDYPQIKGLADSTLQKNINNAIKEDILNQAMVTDNDNYDDDADTTCDRSLNLTYKITIQNNSAISICYQGYGEVVGGMHGSDLCYATTIDVKTGDVLEYSDFIDKDITDKIRSSEEMTNQAYEEIVKEGITNALSKDDLIEYVRTNNYWDYTRYNGGTFFIAQDSLTVSVSAITAIGDYILVTLPVEL